MPRQWLLCLLFFMMALPYTISATTLWPKANTPTRIISLSPHSTEILFALGAGESVIAVSDYCDYPLAATQLPKVGGLSQPNLERIISLQPDLVILLPSQYHIAQRLAAVNITTLTVANRRLHDIKKSIQSIAHATGHHAAAAQLLSTLSSQIHYVQQQVKSALAPRVVISLSHPDTELSSIFIAGRHDFYHDLLLIAGARNAFQHDTPVVPQLSLEGLLALNPDIIIDIFPEANDHAADLAQIQQQWQQLYGLKAVQTQRVHLIEADYATIPGPRIGLLLIQLAQLIHPELDWSTMTTVLP